MMTMDRMHAKQEDMWMYLQLATAPLVFVQKSVLQKLLEPAWDSFSARETVTAEYRF